jgi:LPLT family lysophospholipid transporter-like MFS transporter
LSVNPLAAYGMTGVGAAMYSPAKYGILSQMFGSAKLVRANGMLEGSTIVAILLGVLAGGWLADHSLSWAFTSVLCAYGFAAAVNFLIPRLPPEHEHDGFYPVHLVKAFIGAMSSLLKDKDARFSLIGTSVFWGSGTTLRLMLFAWVPAALLITDNQTPANLMGVVSIGIVIGAGLAGAWITLASVNRALIGGVLLGPVILALSFVGNLHVAMLCMILIGLAGGFFVVPLNALLQERGHESMGAGSALAVQNFVENIAMLIFVGGYSAAAAFVPVTISVLGFGFILLAAIGVLAAFRLRQSPLSSELRL